MSVDSRSKSNGIRKSTSVGRKGSSHLKSSLERLKKQQEEDPLRAIRPGLDNFMKKGQGHGGGLKPQIKREDQPIDLSRVNNPVQDARNKNVLNQLDQISKQNMNARLSKSPTAVIKSKSPDRQAAKIKPSKTVAQK